MRQLQQQKKQKKFKQLRNKNMLGLAHVRRDNTKMYEQKHITKYLYISFSLFFALFFGNKSKKAIFYCISTNKILINAMLFGCDFHKKLTTKQ